MDDDDIKYDFSNLPDKNYLHYVLGVYAACFIAVVIGVAWKLRGYNKRSPKFSEVLDWTEEKSSNQTAAQGARPVARNREDNIPTGSAARRRRNYRERVRQEAPDDEPEENEDDQTNEKDKKQRDSEAKMGAKKLKKLQEKEERRQIRLEMEAEREERKMEQLERERQDKLEEERRKLEEEKKAEEERKIQEEKERREREEYLKLKEMFSVDEEGQADLTSEEQSHNLLQEFVNYIKDNKVVLLEDLASHFGLRTQQAIDRVQEMLRDGILTGVIDDRGKFIYISTEELKSVAEFVEQRGRVSITELAQASNSLVNLKPEAQITLAGST